MKTFYDSHISEYDGKGERPPEPDRDAHWWTVEMDGASTGWVYVAGSLPPPSEAWIAVQLNTLRQEVGWEELERELGRGVHLDRAPRDGDERWHIVLRNPSSTSATSGPWFEKRQEAEEWVAEQPEDVQSRAMVVCDF